MDSGIERRTWATGQGYQLVACVDIQPSGDGETEWVGSDIPWGLAMRRMERCVRPGDRICMLGGSRFGVYLGNGAYRVTPSALGKRVARRARRSPHRRNTELDLQVSIGIGTGSDDVEPAVLTAAAMAAIRVARDQMHRSGTGSHAPFVAVTHVPSAMKHAGVNLCRHVVVSLLDDGDPHAATANGAHANGKIELLPAPTSMVADAPLRLLVVDADGGSLDGSQGRDRSRRRHCTTLGCHTPCMPARRS